MIEVIDSPAEGDTITCSTREEAIALALSELDPGEEVLLHAGDCEGGPDGDGCTCEPDVIVAGERAQS